MHDNSKHNIHVHITTKLNVNYILNMNYILLNKTPIMKLFYCNFHTPKLKLKTVLITWII